MRILGGITLESIITAIVYCVDAFGGTFMLGRKCRSLFLPIHYDSKNPYDTCIKIHTRGY